VQGVKAWQIIDLQRAGDRLEGPLCGRNISARGPAMVVITLDRDVFGDGGAALLWKD
jgi:hypothetical protein